MAARIFAEPDEALDAAERIVQLRAEGRPTSEIAKTVLGEDTQATRRHVFRVIEKSVKAAYDKMTDRIREAFVINDTRLEMLYSRVHAHAMSLTHFDDRVFRVLLMILERQSKLLGLDKGGDQRGSRTGRFLEADAKPTEICLAIERMGVKVPAHIKSDAAIKDLIDDADRGKSLDDFDID